MSKEILSTYIFWTLLYRFVSNEFCIFISLWSLDLFLHHIFVWLNIPESIKPFWYHFVPKPFSAVLVYVSELFSFKFVTVWAVFDLLYFRSAKVPLLAVETFLSLFSNSHEASPECLLIHRLLSGLALPSSSLLVCIFCLSFASLTSFLSFL